jgi:ABC-2 type transport system ATP-binding protein
LDLIKPTSGSATVLGHDTRTDSLEVRRRVGFLPGDLELYPKLTGAHILDFLGKLHGGDDRRVRDELAARFDAQLDRPVRELSTGNRQKIGLIQAFMHEPELVILDEPIAGLDPLVQQSFHDLLREVTSAGRTVFLSSHTLSEVEQVADRIAILRRGRLVVVDTFEHLRAVAVERLEIEFAGPAPDAVLRSVPGVRDVTIEGTRVVVSFEGTADPLVKALSAYDVRTIRSRDADLEEIFLRYYRDEDAP